MQTRSHSFCSMDTFSSLKSMNSFSEQCFYESLNQNTLDYKEKKLPYTLVNIVNSFLQALLLSDIKWNL